MTTASAAMGMRRAVVVKSPMCAAFRLGGMVLHRVYTRGARKKGMELIRQTGRMRRRLPERAAEPACHSCAQIGFRSGAGDVHSAVDEAVDQRADDFRAVQHLAVLAADFRRQLIEMEDLTIEEHDRHFRPCFVVNGRPAGTRLRCHSSRRSRLPAAYTKSC